MSYPREYIAKFLQQPHTATGEQPDLWEFQESADIAPGSGNEGWTDMFWMDEFVHEAPCAAFTGIPYPGIPEEFDSNSTCYYVSTWLNPQTTWIRARAVQEVPYLQSGWSEPLFVVTVPEPSISLSLFVGLIVMAVLLRIRKRKSQYWKSSN
mgnify:CR=1 FL=1